jgi:glycosyltransferase involved in cell wall biosynthesis
MKNILYLGSYKDNNGIATSCRRFIDFLASNRKHNLCVRPIFVTNNNAAPNIKSDKYLEYENNSLKKYDTLIQHVFPDYMEYNANFGKNIGIVDIETMSIKHSGWINKLNLMDEVWVGSEYSARSLLMSGLTTKIKIIPQPYNLSIYENTPADFFSYDQSDKPYIFYTIGQYGDKKNIKSIMMAYLLAFNKVDNVRLFIKTYDSRKDNKILEDLIKNDLADLKNIIRKPSDNYPDIDVLCGYVSEKDIVRLHKSSNCYVNASRGDGFGDNSVEAALCGNITINTKNIGSNTYFNSLNSFLIDSRTVPVICGNSMIKNLYTLKEFWYDPSLPSLMNCMKSAYNLHLTPTIEKQYKQNFSSEIFTYPEIEKRIYDNVFYT